MTIYINGSGKKESNAGINHGDAATLDVFLAPRAWKIPGS